MSLSKIGQISERTDDCDLFSCMNPNLLFHVFKYLKLYDLLALRLASKSTQKISERQLKHETKRLVFEDKQQVEKVKFLCAFYENVSSISIQCTEQFEELLSIIYQHLSKIDELQIQDTFLKISIVSKLFPNLRSLAIESFDEVSVNDDSLSQMLEDFTQLKSLSLSSQFQDYINDAFTSFPYTLTSLSLKFVIIGQERFTSFLKASPNLEHFDLGDSVWIRGESEKQLDLKVFFEEIIRFSNSIKYFSNNFVFSSMRSVGESLNLFGGQSLERIRLKLWNSATFDRSFPILTKVKALCLQDCGEMQDSELSFILSRVPNIEILFLSLEASSLSKSFDAISRLTKLKTLGLQISCKHEFRKWDIFKFASTCNHFVVDHRYFSELTDLVNSLVEMARNRKSDLIKVKMKCSSEDIEFCLRSALPENLIIKSSQAIFSEDFFKSLIYPKEFK
ncbi:hypothetical protein B4U79_18698 [Dinothrombium tinctorium]|uniref:F-box domain-containing protein n=1 Tax=Dinothrombium tinctorium TaxID=1965070 RepID=A0A3S3RHD0_9ACAR|nr:hypothetical protein B4U79_18758 [Dinothrombium tinctorium]RWR99738.1 hypothetical protein B4U79_18752 [Dinothrombium tinctorium]RWR99869.1 hypothetical protein B4U79_18735 [Dinothrombium tinctorium]RWS00203.1 hypothetical protein B4U79_18698 [Dinothrombium tinctorium]